MESLKTPSRYSSVLGHHIQKKKFNGFKLQDYHVLMQQVMPLALWGLLKEGSKMPLMRMSKVFRQICTKVYNPKEYELLKLDVAKSIALLEMEFSPSFFDIMIHLP